MSIRLGILLPSTKKGKMKLPERIINLCNEGNIEIIDLDIESDDLYEKGPFDVFLHKVTAYYNEFPLNDATMKIKKVKRVVEIFKKMVVIDNLEESLKLTDRAYQTELMKLCEITLDGIKTFVPKTVVISSDCSIERINEIIFNNDVKFPILAKPAIASITDGFHDMRLIFSPDNLKDLELPCLLQEFCNHGGIVYKIYLVGDNFDICERPSIKDVDCKSKDTLFFNTRNVSKVGRTFLPDLHSNDPNKRTWMSCDDNPDLLNRKVVTKLCSLMRRLTNLYLLGIDILIEKDTGNYALIDVNYFPGYSGINDKFFPQHLVELVKKLGTSKQV